MTTTDYSKALESALSELEGLLEQEEKIEERILSLRKTVNALSTLCEEAGEKLNWRERASRRLREVLESSITEDILRIVNAARVRLTTTDIKNEMDKVGGLEHQKNPLATINAVLSRLKEQGKVKEDLRNDRRVWESTRPKALKHLGAADNNPPPLPGRKS